MTFNVDVTRKRYYQLMASEPDFFLRTDCSIILMSKRMGINRTYLSMFINHEMKTTFKRLMRAARLRKMEELLVASPDKSINELLHEAGFASDLSFRRAYIEKYGELPSTSRYRLKI